MLSMASTTISCKEVRGLCVISTGPILYGIKANYNQKSTESQGDCD